MNPIHFVGLNLPLSSVHVITSDGEFNLLVINQQITIPDLHMKYKIKEQTIYSCYETYDKSINNIKIEDLFCCTHIGLSNETGDFFPIQRTDIFNNSNELLNIWCEFVNVKNDFLIYLEIFTQESIFDIIPVVINSSTKERNYKKSFFCSFSNSYFRKNQYWNIRIRISDSNFCETRIKFNYLTAQSYNPKMILGGSSEKKL